MELAGFRKFAFVQNRRFAGLTNRELPFSFHLPMRHTAGEKGTMNSIGVTG
jgi:hypothetical protein